MNAQDRLPQAALRKSRPASIAWVEALAATAEIGKTPHRLLCDVISSRAGTHGAAPALLSDRECFTFAELDARIAAYARWAVAEGLKPGDRVALMMTNRPEYPAAWIGLSTAGVIVALINTNLSGRSLAHCLAIARPSHVIVEAGLLDAYNGCSPDWGTAAPTLLIHGEGPEDRRRIDAELQETRANVSAFPTVSVDHKALLIYTSGTTGLPKAAYVSHRRVQNWALWFKGFLGNTEADRMYDCLPLYHSVGGVVAVAATLAAGGSTVIAAKFSARRFWEDIRRWDCTQFQYIGELCRYLLNAPPSEGDQSHGLRAAVGNGLRADVWASFQQRFAIPQIVEFYAATEGNFSLFNGEGKPGSIGRIPPYLRHRFPTSIVKHNPDTGLPLRGADGFCISAQTGEAGEAIGRIGGGGDGSGRFEGYTDESESDRKILHNVFADGDAWFRTGDLMRMDAAGHFYFVDRIGDTFRWKGENVSTLEVESVLAGAPGVVDAVVYGMSVPGNEGKAGMAFLETASGFNLHTLVCHAATQLPSYAMPVFIRTGASAAITETFKHKKQDLVAEGFDPSRTPDPIYVQTDSGIHRLDAELHARLCAGAFRL